MNKILPGFILFFLLAVPCFAEDDDFGVDPEEKARRAHQMSQSDVMYQQEDFRALYHQNEAIIRLLKDIKGELRNLNIRQEKETQA